MYADYIEHQGGDENSIISAEHIDVLTFNRIDFEIRRNRRDFIFAKQPQHYCQLVVDR